MDQNLQLGTVCLHHLFCTIYRIYRYYLLLLILYCSVLDAEGPGK